MEKEEIKNIYKRLTDPSNNIYDVDKTGDMQRLIRNYGRHHFIEFGIEMVKPLNIVNHNIVDRNDQNIIFKTKYDNMSDGELLDELDISRKRMLSTCKICQSFTGIMDKRLFIPFCDYECQKTFYNK
jgi:hypothetical protein